MPPDSTVTGSSECLLRAVGLTKSYRQGHWFSRSAGHIEALRGVAISVRAGSTLGLIGPSGAGKSTLARCLAGIEQADSGEILFEGTNLARRDRGLVPLRRQIQMVFQDASASLSPRLSALEIVSEPLLIAGEPKLARHERAIELIKLVGLPADSANRLASDFSAGQRRRLAIARALSLRPKILILDEALSGLDLSIQAQISNLLLELQAAWPLTYICISHDVSLVAHLSDEIAILDRGQIVKSGNAVQFLSGPQESPATLQQNTSSQTGSLKASSP